jgi:3-hydroxymyristoyl/3-hydroxydecanoyl-(acyl carrier protein) dehydratase
VKSTDSQDFEIIIQIPEVHACYADHFAGNPLVPGALLLKWIMAGIENHAQCELVFIKQIKFLAAVKPTDELRVLVNVNPANANYSVNVLVSDICVIKGVMQAPVAQELSTTGSGND